MYALIGRTALSRVTAAVFAVLCLGAVLGAPKPAEARIWVGVNFGYPAVGYYAPYYPAYYPYYGYGYYPRYHWRRHYHRMHYSPWRHRNWCHWHPYRCRYY
jgi:hypothetical protein